MSGHLLVRLTPRQRDLLVGLVNVIVVNPAVGDPYEAFGIRPVTQAAYRRAQEALQAAVPTFTAAEYDALLGAWVDADSAHEDSEPNARERARAAALERAVDKVRDVRA